jgi:hypothetical protein
MRRSLVVSALLIVSATVTACGGVPPRAARPHRLPHAPPTTPLATPALVAGDDVGLVAFRPQDLDGTRVASVPIDAD